MCVCNCNENKKKWKYIYISWKINKILLSVLIKVKDNNSFHPKVLFHGIWLGTIQSFMSDLFQFVILCALPILLIFFIFSSSKLFFPDFFYQNYL